MVDKNSKLNEISTNNRFEILSNDIGNESDDSSSDFFDMVNTSSQSRKFNSRKPKNTNRNSNKSNNTYANAVKSSLNTTSDDEDDKILRNKILGNKDINQKEHNNTRNNVIRVAKDIHSKSNTQESDYSANDYKESFFYLLMNKAKRFSKKTSMKYLDFWFEFILDLFDFVGQKFEDTE